MAEYTPSFQECVYNADLGPPPFLFITTYTSAAPLTHVWGTDNLLKLIFLYTFPVESCCWIFSPFLACYEIWQKMFFIVIYNIHFVEVISNKQLLWQMANFGLACFTNFVD